MRHLNTEHRSLAYLATKLRPSTLLTLVTLPSCGTCGQHRLCTLARYTSSMHACTERRSSCRLVRLGFLKQAIPIASSSSREIVPDSASSTHRSFRFSRVMRVPCCHVAPLYHVTLLPAFYLPCPDNAYELCTQTFRHFCICTSIVLFVRVCVQQSYYRHRCGEWRTKSWRMSTSRIARSDRQRSRW